MGNCNQARDGYWEGVGREVVGGCRESPTGRASLSRYARALVYVRKHLLLAVWAYMCKYDRWLQAVPSA